MEIVNTGSKMERRRLVSIQPNNPHHITTRKFQAALFLKPKPRHPFLTQAHGLQASRRSAGTHFQAAYIAPAFRQPENPSPPQKKTVWRNTKRFYLFRLPLELHKNFSPPNPAQPSRPHSFTASSHQTAVGVSKTPIVACCLSYIALVRTRCAARLGSLKTNLAATVQTSFAPMLQAGLGMPIGRLFAGWAGSRRQKYGFGRWGFAVGRRCVTMRRSFRAGGRSLGCCALPTRCCWR